MDWTTCQKYYYQALTNIKSIFINFCHVLKSKTIDNYMNIELVN